MAVEWRPETTVEWLNERFEAGIGRLIIKDEDKPVIRRLPNIGKTKTFSHGIIAISDRKKRSG